MRHAKPLLALILTAALPFSALAAGQTQGRKSTAPLTVGDFAVMLAATTGRGPALEVKSATEALVKAGVPLGNPRETLSEEQLVEIPCSELVTSAGNHPRQGRGGPETGQRCPAEQSVDVRGHDPDARESRRLPHRNEPRTV